MLLRHTSSSRHARLASTSDSADDGAEPPSSHRRARGLRAPSADVTPAAALFSCAGPSEPRPDAARLSALLSAKRALAHADAAAGRGRAQGERCVGSARRHQASQRGARSVHAAARGHVRAPPVRPCSSCLPCTPVSTPQSKLAGSAIACEGAGGGLSACWMHAAIQYRQHAAALQQRLALCPQTPVLRRLPLPRPPDRRRPSFVLVPH